MRRSPAPAVAAIDGGARPAQARRAARRAKTGTLVTLHPGAGKSPQAGQQAPLRRLPPEHWRLHPEAWPIYKAGPRNPLASSVQGERPDFSVPEPEKLTKAVLEGRLSGDAARAYAEAPRGALLAEVFGAGVGHDARLTLMQALWMAEAMPDKARGGPDAGRILAHAVAAVLNALYFGVNEFGYSKDDIVHMTRAKLMAGQGRKLLADLMTLNGCAAVE